MKHSNLYKDKSWTNLYSIRLYFLPPHRSIIHSKDLQQILLIKDIRDTDFHADIILKLSYRIRKCVQIMFGAHINLFAWSTQRCKGIKNDIHFAVNRKGKKYYKNLYSAHNFSIRRYSPCIPCFSDKRGKPSPMICSNGKNKEWNCCG